MNKPLVVCIMEMREDGVLLAPYHLQRKKFVGPVRFVYTRGGKEIAAIQLAEAMTGYREGAEPGLEVAGVTDAVRDICGEHGVPLDPKWQIYSGGK